MKSRDLLFVGCCNRPASYFVAANGKGVSTFEFDAATGHVSPLNVVESVDNPTFIVADARRRRVYAISEMAAWSEGRVSALAIDPASGALTLINQQSTRGNTTAQISLDRTGRFLLAANYRMVPQDGAGDASIAVLPLDPYGGLGAAVSSAMHVGKTGPNKERQDRPHAHAVLAAPDNHFLVASDLGLDQLVVYRFHAEGRIERVGDIHLPEGSGPRHFVFGPSTDRIYVVDDSIPQSAHFRSIVRPVSSPCSKRSRSYRIIGGRTTIVPRFHSVPMAVFCMSAIEVTTASVCFRSAQMAL